jgi:hypothetical protein
MPTIDIERHHEGLKKAIGHREHVVGFVNALEQDGELIPAKASNSVGIAQA